ncbi:MAG: anhydro-N-acetylmuramic acid kinase [Bacteroidetes bacterium]|nr:anhydro-N-acetylmuramic acid kinase [Bacteroidota bacterium]
MPYTGIGLMSGTSADGLDICLAQFTLVADRWQGELLLAETVPYDADWQRRLRLAPAGSAEALGKLHTDFGHLQGLLLRRFLVTHQVTPQWVATHGHTVFHQPKEQHFTTQIGCLETLVTYLDCPLVGDLRSRDVAQGGTGAPLVPMGEQQLWDSPLFLNLGGIANISVFRPQDSRWQVYTQRGPKPYAAWDVAPCNLVLNHVLHQMLPDQAYDAHGQLAAGGTLIPELLHKLEALPFYYMPPPRVLGWEFVQQEVLPLLEPYLACTADVLHTWCHHLAHRLFAELERFDIRDSSLYVTGGGAHHSFLMHCLADKLADRGITLAEVPPLMVDFKEAYIFAFLGLMTLLRRPNVLTEVTGARTQVCAGSIHLPESWRQALL